MANYPGATPPYPRRRDIQSEFSNQSESEKYRNVTVSFCNKREININELVGFTLGFLEARNTDGIEDLLVFMEALGEIYNIRHAQRNESLYEAIKGLPAHSDNRIGYTFQRRKSGNKRGVFLFLR